jgi:succinate dehydrogenase / fumarate reductase cytochrome b subunit
VALAVTGISKVLGNNEGAAPQENVTTATKIRRRPHSFLLDFYRSAVGKKWVMALSGVALLGFVLAHMIGNLKIFLGPEPGGGFEIDQYAEALRSLLYPLLPRHVVLWGIRLVLIAAFAVHIHAAITLTLVNRRARPIEYQGPRQYLVANYASRTMRWSGFIVLAFIAFHLADFTWGIQPMAPDNWEAGSVHANMVASFSRPAVTALYVIANLLLGIHIFHGAWSMFQSLGVAHPRFNPWRRWFAIAFAAVIVAGNVAMPVAVQFGVIQ